MKADPQKVYPLGVLPTLSRRFLKVSLLFGPSASLCDDDPFQATVAETGDD